MMLSIRSLNQSYGQSRTLWDLELHISAGSCVSLIGRNGVGKTTLLNSIMGLLKVDSGSIDFEGQSLLIQSAEARARLGIGYVPQGRMIFPLLTVQENLRIGLGALPRKQRTLPDHVFQLFPVLKDMLDRRGGDLSGGQQQQLALARALVLRPRLLVLDEPTEGVQPSIVQEIGAVIRSLNQEFAMTVLLVEQKLPFVQRVADSFHIMNKGSILASGTMPELTEDLVAKHLSV